MLPESAIKEFIEIYRKHYGVILTIEEAKIKAQNFLLFFKSISNEIANSNMNIKLIQEGGGNNGNFVNSHRV